MIGAPQPPRESLIMVVSWGNYELRGSRHYLGWWRMDSSERPSVASTATFPPRESGERLQGEIADAINIKAAGSSEVK